MAVIHLTERIKRRLRFIRKCIPFLKNHDEDDSDWAIYDLDVECELSTSVDRKPQRRHDENNQK